MYGHRGLPRQIHGEHMIRVRPNYRAVQEDFEPEVYRALKSHASPGTVTLDIGSHMGIYTMLLALWSAPNGQVYAFEPTPQTRAALEDHLMLNHITDRVTVAPLAVSDQCGKATFYATTDAGENTLCQSRSGMSGTVSMPVETITIDAYCQQQNLAPTLIKIDIEGYEIHALRGARETLRQYQPTVIVEMHPVYWPDIGISREAATATLDELGYRVVSLENQADPLAEFGHVILEPLA